MSLFNRMAEAVIGELSAEERAGLTEAAFRKVVKACHDVAVRDGTAHRFPVTEPTPPRMQFLRVDTVHHGDQVWMPDCHFASVDMTEPAGENIHVFFLDGQTATVRGTRNAKVAIRVDDAREWNAVWGHLDEEARSRVADRYGYRSVAV